MCNHISWWWKDGRLLQYTIFTWKAECRRLYNKMLSVILDLLKALWPSMQFWLLRDAQCPCYACSMIHGCTCCTMWMIQRKREKCVNVRIYSLRCIFSLRLSVFYIRWRWVQHLHYSKIRKISIHGLTSDMKLYAWLN